MKRVKTYLRSTMTSSRLNNLTLMSIEREISGKFIENPSAVIDEFASMKKENWNFLSKNILIKLYLFYEFNFILLVLKQKINPCT